MAKAKKTTPKTTAVRVERPTASESTFLDKVQQQVNFSDKQSLLNLVLGGLIVIVIGILLFNYFNRPSGNLGPSQQTDQQNQDNKTADVTKEELPGKYTIKEGDTLFTVAQKYYNDGYKYDQIAKANNLQNPDMIEVGQSIDIPKLDDNQQIANQTSSPTPQAEMSPSVAPSAEPQPATGGADNQTIWGEKISGDTYTVQPGDWLTKIAGRAYGDIDQYSKIAQANNITNPDIIEVGTVLKLPR